MNIKIVTISLLLVAPGIVSSDETGTNIPKQVATEIIKKGARVGAGAAIGAQIGGTLGKNIGNIVKGSPIGAAAGIIFSPVQIGCQTLDCPKTNSN